MVKTTFGSIELLGVFIKPFSLMIRLYANILAGHIVLYSLIGLIFILKLGWIKSITCPSVLHFNYRSTGCIIASVYFYASVCLVFWFCSTRGRSLIKLNV